jgi:hypothetical protein
MAIRLRLSPKPFRHGDVVTDWWRLAWGYRQVYRVLAGHEAGTMKVAVWDDTAMTFAGVLILPAGTLRLAPDDWPQVRNVRVWEGEVRKVVQHAAELVLARIGGVA